MEHGQLTHHVRKLVAERFRELGIETPVILETILIRDGNYYGRRFETDGVEAVWLVENDQLTFSVTEGEVPRTLSFPVPSAIPFTKAA